MTDDIVIQLLKGLISGSLMRMQEKFEQDQEGFPIDTRIVMGDDEMLMVQVALAGTDKWLNVELVWPGNVKPRARSEGALVE
jgi:hypothetical protein